MAKPGAGKKASSAQRAQYAPKPKRSAARPQPKPAAERHLVVDDTLRKIIQRVLEELKVPGKIPSEVIFAALAEVRDLVERAAAAGPSAKVR
jgi:hypothetical protein